MLRIGWEATTFIGNDTFSVTGGGAEINFSALAFAAVAIAIASFGGNYTPALQ